LFVCRICGYPTYEYEACYALGHIALQPFQGQQTFWKFLGPLSSESMVTPKNKPTLNRKEERAAKLNYSLALKMEAKFLSETSVYF
jgi:hypothetical protein